jgi:hypothetical protein
MSTATAKAMRPVAKPAAMSDPVDAKDPGRKDDEQSDPQRGRPAHQPLGRRERHPLPSSQETGKNCRLDFSASHASRSGDPARSV